MPVKQLKISGLNSFMQFVNAINVPQMPLENEWNKSPITDMNKDKLKAMYISFSHPCRIKSLLIQIYIQIANRKEF